MRYRYTRDRALIRQPLIRQSTLAIRNHLSHKPGLRIEFIRIQNLLDRISGPIGLDKLRMPPRNLNRGGGELRNTQPVGLARAAVEPFMRGLHMKRRVGPILIQVISAKTSACEPAQQLQTVTWTQMMAYITHGDARCCKLRSGEDGEPPSSAFIEQYHAQFKRGNS
ncbi:hypothetical protein Bxe_A2204 [Paraburkholderia xenovorans LB400]|uniref:Uncharacterized protein n=1 Tax=Paraburkholderia xenovorans (strain LB400) TaxID=266265 RepID=Q13YS4_PARXL|nr:hypothetical protein Bxe_A2204 [Paraburkholderia xenovorans LB400]